jgi:hypothetical protein
MAHAHTRAATLAPLAAVPLRTVRRKRGTWIPGQVARSEVRGGWATDIALLHHLWAREAQDIIGKLDGVALLVQEDD